MTPILVLALYFIVVTAAAAAVLTEYRRCALGRVIKSQLRGGPKTQHPAVTTWPTSTS